jgi:hypothetical protein
MKTLFILLIVGFTAFVSADEQTNAIPPSEPSGPTVETIVCVRHGEKPHGGLGQLSCRGLNRALALPNVLLGKFGPPQFVFAPNPTQKVDSGGQFYYVRPLVTIDPTAIRCGLPINTQFGYAEIDSLEAELERKPYHRATIFLAWEHGLLDTLAKNMLKRYGENPNKVPPWPSNDFDSIFVLKIIRAAGREKITFSIDHENLNNLSDECPGQ